MAQIPATPKTRRARLRARLWWRGAHATLQREPSLTPAEHSALTLNTTGAPTQTPQHVTFLIPLVGQAHVGDWNSVLSHLTTTLESFIAQSSPNWRAVICCQDHPAKLPRDPRIHTIPFTPTREGNDKWDKLHTLSHALPNISPEPGYAMPFDADDLLHKRTVATMLSLRAPGGYLSQKGYVADLTQNRLAQVGPPNLRTPRQRPFWKLCGSCTALRYDTRSLPAFTAFLAKMTQHEHRMFPHLAALAGLPLTPLQDPMTLYMLNHGENFGARRGRTRSKTALVERYALPHTSHITTNFPNFKRH